MSTAPYASPTTTHRRGEPSNPTAAVVAILLGILVAVLGFFALLMWVDAHKARDDAHRAAGQATSAAAMPGMDMSSTSAAGLQSYAGASPANADAIATAHEPFPATLPAAPAGAVADVHLVLKDVTVQVAPGMKYAAWAWAGGAPGPVIHVRQGQLVKITLTNSGAIPHSVDFHAARVAPDKAFGDVMPGKSVSYTFRANDPGVFMYHCGTKPVLMHIANGMYGAIVVEPPAGTLPKADKNYVLVASEWYLDSDGLSKPAQFNMDKAHARQPDWMTFNGYAGQYVKHPLTAKPGEPSASGSSTPARRSTPTSTSSARSSTARGRREHDNRPTRERPDGRGARRRRRRLRREDRQAGPLPVVSHAFAAVDQGQVGLLNVGGVQGTMTH